MPTTSRELWLPSDHTTIMLDLRVCVLLRRISSSSLECSTAASNWKVLAAEGGAVYPGQLALIRFLKRVSF